MGTPELTQTVKPARRNRTRIPRKSDRITARAAVLGTVLLQRIWQIQMIQWYQKNHHSSNMDNSTSNNNITTSNETRASSKGKAKNKKNKKLQGKLMKRQIFCSIF